MCGIFGYIGQENAAPLLLEGLKRLEYRGYDSAGLPVLQNGKLEIRRSMGKLANLERLLTRLPVGGSVGIGHTRWATHGKPTTENAHPHRNCSQSLALVHNGIIENYAVLREQLKAQGHRFESETDTEIVAHLLEEAPFAALDSAVQWVMRQLKGSFAIAIISQQAPDTLVAIRHGGPSLVIGRGANGLLLASNVTALLPYTKDMLILEDDELAVLTGRQVRLITLEGIPVHRPTQRVTWDRQAVEKNGYAHYMLKEIHEQPEVIARTIEGLVPAEADDVRPSLSAIPRKALAQVDRLVILGCGSSWHAGLVGKYVIESLCQIPVEVERSSEFLCRTPIIGRNVLTLAISQSGETADTLAALRKARKHGSGTVALCNVPGSSLGREADSLLCTQAGPEIGVASTKSFTTQLVTLLLLAIAIGRVRNCVSATEARSTLKVLREVPSLANRLLAQQNELFHLAARFVQFGSFLYLGRGIQYPVAQEGALKLKEISYIHAEGNPAGERKHGPIALVDRNMPVVALTPEDHTYDKMLCNIKKSRQGMESSLRWQATETRALPRLWTTYSIYLRSRITCFRFSPSSRFSSLPIESRSFGDAMWTNRETWQRA